MPITRLVIPTPFKVGPVNVYLIREDPLTLIDAGPHTPEAEATLKEGLAREGFSLRDIRRVILTHGHPDHYGLAAAIRDLSGAEIYLNGRELEKTAQEVNFVRERGSLLRWAGIPAGVLEMVEKVYIGDREYAEPLKDPLPIVAGQVLPFERHALRVYHLRGHSTGQCNFYEATERVFFSGDNLLAHITPNPLLEPGDDQSAVLTQAGRSSTGATIADAVPGTSSSTLTKVDGGLTPSPAGGPPREPTLSLYLETLQVIESLEIDLVYPGHGPKIKDHRGRIAEIRAHHLTRQGEILAALNGRPKTVLELSRRFFPDLQGFDVFLGVSEVQAHLDVLAKEGRVRVREEKGVGYYSR